MPEEACSYERCNYLVSLTLYYLFAMSFMGRAYFRRCCHAVSGRSDTALVGAFTQFLPMRRNGFSCADHSGSSTYFRVRALRLSHLAIHWCSYLALFNETYKGGRQTEQDHLHHTHARQLLDLTLINSVSVDQYINGFTVDMLKVRLSGSTKTLINAVPKTFS